MTKGLVNFQLIWQSPRDEKDVLGPGKLGTLQSRWPLVRHPNSTFHCIENKDMANGLHFV